LRRWWRTRRCGALLTLLLGPPASAVAAPLEEIVVSTARLSEPAAHEAYAVTRLSAADLAARPQARLDAILTALPGVSLFRRADSRVAHPTTQGVTLRGIGPNGAGRALVLLDGVPLNDPFGGWVAWSAIDTGSLAAVEIRRGSGTGAFASQALTGTVVLETRRPDGRAFRGRVRTDSDATIDVAGAVGAPIGRTRLLLTGQYFDSDGFMPVPRAQRGPVDAAAASRASHAALLGESELGDSLTLVTRLAWFGERRTNGTPLARNATDGIDASLRLVADHARAGPSYTLTLYGSDRDFSNLFTAVDAARTGERPVLDQFAVPSRGAGMSASVRWPLLAADTLEIGADWRRLEGTTNERFRNLGAGFTRLRRAGGDERFLGLWADYAGTLAPGTVWTAALRLDRWRAFNGLRRESDLASGAILRDDAIADRAGTLVNGRVGLRTGLSDAVYLRLAAYSGFRLPTINEFYRPFRVGNDITEANPALDPERLYGYEAGLRYDPAPPLHLGIDVYRNRLENAVGNITLAEGPGVFPPTGFVPAGGSLRRRHNIDRVRAQGIESEARLALGPAVALVFRHLYSRTRVRRNAAAPALVGKRLPQSPKQTLSLSVQLAPGADLRIALWGRYVSDQFEDDRNSRKLPSYATLDLSASWRFAPAFTLRLAAENLLDATVVNRITGDGRVTRARSRRLSGGLAYAF